MQKTNVTAFDWRSWLMWIPLAIPLLPLAAGQGLIGEAVFILMVFVGKAHDASYFFPFILDYTRTLVALPFALALLTPWPEWAISAALISCWMLTAALTLKIARHLFPQDETAALLAFFLAGITAYDTSLLRAEYVQLHIACLFHLVGVLGMLIYCERRSRHALWASALAQLMSVAFYAAALPAIALGPILAIAAMAPRGSIRAAVRPALAVAAAWWPVAIVYVLALALIAMQPRSYIVAGGGLSLPSLAEYVHSVGLLVIDNFNPIAWLFPARPHGDPPRLVPAAFIVLGLVLSVVLMVLLLIAAYRASPPLVRTASSRLLLSLVAIVVASNMATALLQMANMRFRTHLVSRLYAALVIAALASYLVHARSRVNRGIGWSLILACLACGLWTVFDRTAHLTSTWARHRIELQSLDSIVRRLDPSAGIVLYVPPGSGYTATVAPWHAQPWLMIIRGGKLPPDAFALWSPDRGAVCATRERVLHCEGDRQKPVDIPLDRLVVLRYSAADCRWALVQNDSTKGLALGSPYDPDKWVRSETAPMSAMFGKLMYGPQWLEPTTSCQYK